MSAQPEALQLADEYASDGWIAGTRQWCEETAAELRRQHAEIEQLREQNTTLDAACSNLEAQRDELLEALKQMVSIVVIHSNATGNNFAWAELDEARAVIAKCQ